MMVAFLQTYGFWIFLIVLFLLMMRMHGGHGMGGCCGMEGMEHDQRSVHHQHTGSEPKSDDLAHIISSHEGGRDYYQSYQGRMSDVPAQEEVEQSSTATQPMPKYY